MNPQLSKIETFVMELIFMEGRAQKDKVVDRFLKENPLEKLCLAGGKVALDEHIQLMIDEGRVVISEDGSDVFIQLPEPDVAHEPIEAQLADLKSQLDAFIAHSKTRMFNASERIITDSVTLYVKTKMNVDAGKHICVGSIDLSPHQQNKGLFKQLAVHMEKLAKEHFGQLEYECVQNPKLETMLIKHGYRSIDKHALVKSYMKTF